MILKMTNKDKDFYNYMGRFFGSRIVQTETKDRIYDDGNKVWYIYLNKDNKACAFVAVTYGIIKNVYTTAYDELKSLLLYVKDDVNLVKDSIVTKTYEDIYKECGFEITELEDHKNFIMIRGDKNV